MNLRFWLDEPDKVETTTSIIIRRWHPMARLITIMTRVRGNILRFTQDAIRPMELLFQYFFFQW